MKASNSLSARPSCTGTFTRGRHHLGGLVAVAGDADDDRLVARNRAVLDQLDRARQRRAARGLGEDAFGLRDQLHGVENLAVGRHRARAAARADGGEHLESVGRIADRDRSRDRVRLHGIGKLETVLERLDDRRAAGRLRGVNRRQIAVDQADFLQLAECARNARQQRAARHGRDDVLRECPAELFGDFEAVGLRAFGVVAAQVDVRESPAVLLRNLRAQPVHIVVVALDGDDLRVVDARAENLARLEIVRNEDVALQPEARGVRRHAVGEVAGRRAAEHLESELDGTRRRNRDDAILVRERRMVDGIVLEIQLADAQLLRETIGFDERRESRIEAGARLAVDRQQLAVAPQVLRARLDLRAAHVLPDLVVVVDDFERSQTFVAHPQRLCRKHRLAQVTLQSGYVSHISSTYPTPAPPSGAARETAAR